MNEIIEFIKRALAGDRTAARELFLEFGRLEGWAHTEYRRGWQDCLDHLGAPDPGAAPMERAARLKVALA
jgi:hypothetical protein